MWLKADTCRSHIKISMLKNKSGKNTYQFVIVIINIFLPCALYHYIRKNSRVGLFGLLMVRLSCIEFQNFVTLKLTFKVLSPGGIHPYLIPHNSFDISIEKSKH